ncbi:MAG TPA: hypothetical protein VLG25_01190 [Patescibacteria group bacterium]|nr:hypothetical protein [Patescibacteria group bacterium]
MENEQIIMTPETTPPPKSKWPLQNLPKWLVLGCVLLTVSFFGATGLLIYRHYRTKPPSTSQLATTNYIDPSGGYSLQLPIGWQVQTNLAAPAGVTEQIGLAPTIEVENYKKAHKNDFLEFVTVQIIKSKSKPQAWFDSLGLGKPVDSAKISLDSRPAYAAKTIGPAGMDDHYVISNNGVIIHMVFHQRVTVNGTNIDNTKYLQGFDRIATSIRFL